MSPFLALPVLHLFRFKQDTGHGLFVRLGLLRHAAPHLGSEPFSKRLVRDAPNSSEFATVPLLHVNVVGEGNLDSKDRGNKAYIQKERLHEDFGNVLAAADLVISRADANSMYEFLAMRKSHLLIPLSTKASRGEQIRTAAIFEKVGMSMVVQDVDLTPESLIASLDQLKRKRKARLVALKKFKALDAVKIISNLVAKTTK